MGRGCGNLQRYLLSAAAAAAMSSVDERWWSDPPWVCLRGLTFLDQARSARQALHRLEARGLVIVTRRPAVRKYLSSTGLEQAVRSSHLWFRLSDDQPPMKWYLDEDDPTTARRLALVYDRGGLSQEALAKAAGLHPSTISRIELGKRKPRQTTLDKISDALM